MHVDLALLGKRKSRRDYYHCTKECAGSTRLRVVNRLLLSNIRKEFHLERVVISTLCDQSLVFCRVRNTAKVPGEPGSEVFQACFYPPQELTSKS